MNCSKVPQQNICLTLCATKMFHPKYSMQKSRLIIFITLFVSGCGYKGNENSTYPNNKNISNSEGIPKDSATYFFPTTIKTENQIINIKIDSFKLEWFSKSLFFAHEPILFNNFQGHEIYRFLWLRSFHNPMVYTLNKNGENVWLSIKELDSQPELSSTVQIKFIPPVPKTREEQLKASNIDRIVKLDNSISYKKPNPKIIFKRTVKLSLKEWNEFETIINKNKFWKTVSTLENNGFDGAEWTLEGHLSNKYWFVNRWSPDDGLRKAGIYLIEKSGRKEEIY